MKKILFFLLISGLFLDNLCAAGIYDEVSRENEKADISYAFGMAIAADLRQTGLEFNYGAFMRGFRETMENQKTRFTLDEAVDRVETAFMASMAERAEINRQEEEQFLAENKTRPGVITTPSGLQYEVIEEGKGEIPSPYDTVRVQYTGRLLDGTVFDSSWDRGEPEEFPLQGVIPGWSEGIQLMKEGGKSRFYIPSKLAYGSQGAGNFIPPNSVIIFDVEFLNILRDEVPAYIWEPDPLR